MAGGHPLHVLAEHSHRDGDDVFRIRKPHQGMVKIANEPVWDVTGVQTWRFRSGTTRRTHGSDELRKPLTLECCFDSFSGLFDVEHETIDVHTKSLNLQVSALDVSTQAERARRIRTVSGRDQRLTSVQGTSASVRGGAIREMEGNKDWVVTLPLQHLHLGPHRRGQGAVLQTGTPNR